MALTTVLVDYPTAAGRLALRGSPPALSWERSVAGRRDEDGRWRFVFDAEEGAVVEFKLIRDEVLWSRQRNYSVAGGQTVGVGPYFEREKGRLEHGVYAVRSEEFGRDVRFQVYLPPSYDEQPGRRYPVLYAQDGHVLFTTSPTNDVDRHTWRMDETLDFLWELGAMEDVILVALHTREQRLETLTPTADPRFGGGDGGRYLDFLAGTLKPFVDARWRTRTGREHTALIGASLGGLFSFYAAWTRPAVFGRAACLSSSFWWDGRSMVREVQKAWCPFPRPWLYIDSGAAIDPFEQDSNVRDGFHHTSALTQALVQHCYTPGDNVHSLAFAGYRHDNASWAARLAIPLQLLFPRAG